MSQRIKQWIIIFLTVSIALGGLAYASEGDGEPKTEDYQTPGRIAYDIVIIRPFSFLATVAGSTIFLVSLPISAGHGSSKTAYKKLVAEPAGYTFKRSLGDF